MPVSDRPAFVSLVEERRLFYACVPPLRENAALACRTQRKQVTMQSNSRRDWFSHSLLVIILISLAVPAWAATGSTTTPPAKTKTKAKTETKSTAKASTPAAPPADQIPVVYVTAATRHAQSPDTTATSSTVITHDDIEKNQYISVAQALMSVPGLAVVPTGVPGQITSVFSRGTSSDMTLFTIDGRRQAPGLDGAYDFANLTLDNVDQIEVVRTPTDLLGGNTTGGVINLVTLSGRGLDRPVSSVSFEGGSYDTFRETAQSRGAVGNFDYAVSGSNEDSDMDRPNEDYRNTVYRGNFGYQVSSDVYVDVHSGYSLADAGNPNTIYTPDPSAHQQTEDWFISPEVTAKVTDFYTTKLFYNHDEQRQRANDLYSSPDGFSILPLSTLLQIDTDSVDWQNNFQIARNWQITAGIQSDNISVNQYTYVNDYDFPPVMNMTTLENSLFNIGGYVASQWEPVTGLNVLSSIRDDQYSDYNGAVSWRQAVSYRVPWTQTVVHASGSSTYTPPSQQDLYYVPYNNPNLKPETSLGWEAGVAQPLLKGKLTPSATYFHNDITNYIEFIFNPMDFSDKPFNVGHATTDGVELDLKAQPFDQLALDLNYTYLDAMDDSLHTRLAHRPRNSLNFTAVWTPLEPLTLSMGGSWVADRMDYDPDPAVMTTVRAPDYFVLRASATWKINRYLSLWIRGENLTDEHYQPVLGYPALGAAGYGGLKISF
ncbi:MAG: TonB-dependent receptor [Methylacidiphilales bacterium]|nr:TonB-dependent receptor [Candidatus Methylacidiphilales bacterium]